MILISSFYNEEYLLPWWLKHHKEIFEHGILFDYFSTDNSRKIIEDICPDWEVRVTKNRVWDFEENDREFVEAEREISGYKMVLTTTEFLIGNYNFLKDEPTCYAVPVIRMVDDEPDRKPSPQIPLVRQKTTGYPQKMNKYRFLHNHRDGDYMGLGRHRTGHECRDCDNIRVWKYAYSPWNETFIERKLSMKDHMDNTVLGGKHHRMNRKQLEKKYKEALEEV